MTLPPVKSQELLLMLCALLLPLTTLVIAADLQELGKTMRIDIYQNATARWEFQERVNLTDPDQVEAFMLFIQEQNLNKTALIQEFSSKFSSIVNRASVLTGRPMMAYDFDLSFGRIPTITGGDLGLITYSFKWQGFAAQVENKLLIGDVFEGGFYLFDGDVLVIDIPTNYTLSSISPTPDRTFAGEVTWLGRKAFDPGNPYLELKSKVVTITTHATKTEVGVGESISILGAVYPPSRLNLILTYAKPDGTEFERFISSSPDGTFSDIVKAEENGRYTFVVTWTGSETLNPAQSNAISVVVVQTLPSLAMAYWPFIVAVAIIVIVVALLLIRRRAGRRTTRSEVLPGAMERDEAVVLSLLRSRGGMLPQSEIKELAGFSKAKTSFILRSLQEKGLIWKEKWGREFLVHLRDESRRP